MHALTVLQALALLLAANGAPVVAKDVLGARFAWPLDGGIAFFDGQPLFGASKTVRGVLVAVLAAAGAAPLVGLDWRLGAVIGAGAMAGDLCSSFVKRRLGWAPHSRALGLDQIPESLLPLLACQAPLGLGALDIVVCVAAFMAAELLLSRLLYRFRLRDRPW